MREKTTLYFLNIQLTFTQGAELAYSAVLKLHHAIALSSQMETAQVQIRI
jgi:hypothetical protein